MNVIWSSVLVISHHFGPFMRILPPEGERDQSCRGGCWTLCTIRIRTMATTCRKIPLLDCFRARDPKKSRGLGCSQATRGIERPLWFLTLHYQLSLFSFHLSSLMCVTLQSSRVVASSPASLQCFIFFDSDVLFFHSSSNLCLLLCGLLSSFFPRVLSLSFVLFMLVYVVSQSSCVFSLVVELFRVGVDGVRTGFGDGSGTTTLPQLTHSHKADSHYSPLKEIKPLWIWNGGQSCLRDLCQLCAVCF